MLLGRRFRRRVSSLEARVGSAGERQRVRRWLRRRDAEVRHRRRSARRRVAWDGGRKRRLIGLLASSRVKALQEQMVRQMGLVRAVGWWGLKLKMRTLGRKMARMK